MTLRHVHLGESASNSDDAIKIYKGFEKFELAIPWNQIFLF